MSIFKNLFGKKDSSCCNVVIQEVKEADGKCCDKKEQETVKNEQESTKGTCCK
ncbi:hypothetical protein [Brevibacillus sp. SYSU BS000544]|uniref:hypothetical protein n=1 Tax=Brevibacillus sp. SYSU BS000544 TaxID=3416443 RepID=UPI003CE52F0E